MKLKPLSARLGVVFVLAPVVLVLASGPALAADNVIVTNSETVQAHLNPDGTVIDPVRVYDQLALQGNGSVVIKNPVSTDNLRNLDGFGSFAVTNNGIFSRQTVDGSQRLRSVSSYTKKLPLQVTPTYKLNGKTVEAGDVVGKSGRLEVHYKVQNVTGQDVEVTYDDGTGKQVTSVQKVVIPMVGTLTTVLPSNFVSVASAEANMAGDGRGRTQLSFTMTLFGPIGSPVSEFGYSATVTGGVIPDASITALSVNPLESPPFKGGAASYKAGATSGVQLTAGAIQIDANVLKLRDGAQTLIAGLIQLRDGAQKLNVGLAGEAAPGAYKLASGATQLNDGAGKLAVGASDATAGAGKLAAGTDTLAAGTTKLDAGAGALQAGLGQASAKAPALLVGLAQVTDGLKKVDSGLAQLYGGIGQLPAKAQPIHDGIQSMLQGIGNVSTPDTLVFGVHTIQVGLAAATSPGGPLDKLKGGVDQSKGGVDQIKSGLDAALVPNTGSLDQLRGGVTTIKGGLDAALAPSGSIDQLAGGVTAAKNTAGCLGDPVCQANLAAVFTGIDTTLRHNTALASGGLGQVSGGLDQLVAQLTTAQAGLGEISGGLGQVSPGLALLKTQLAAASLGLIRVECGLDNTLSSACPAAPGLRQGLFLVDGGVSQLVNGVVAQVQGAVGQSTDVAPAQNTLRGGVHAVMGGIDLIGAGGLTLLAGLNQLNAGAGTLKAGTSELDTGAQKLNSGASQLYTGLGQLSSGATKLSDGTTQLSDGANKLATGLGDAANGSALLAGGLMTAAEGGQALPAGATQLSVEGTSKLVESGKTTASDYGLKYAEIVAGAQRANTEAMAFGSPASAAGTTAYSLEIAGANGDAGTNISRGLAGVVLLAGGAGLIAYRRRFV